MVTFLLVEAAVLTAATLLALMLIGLVELMARVTGSDEERTHG